MKIKCIMDFIKNNQVAHHYMNVLFLMISKLFCAFANLLITIAMMTLTIEYTQNIYREKCFSSLSVAYANDTHSQSVTSEYITLREIKRGHSLSQGRSESQSKSLQKKKENNRNIIKDDTLKQHIKHETTNLLPLNKEKIIEVINKDKKVYSTNNKSVNGFERYNVYHIEDYIFSDHEGKKYKIDDFRESLLILYFWASWSMESIDGLKSLNKLSSKLKNDKIGDILILPISIDSRKQDYMENIYKKNAIKHIPLLFDIRKIATSMFHINTPPTTFIIGKNFKVIERFNIILTWSDDEVYQNLVKMKDGEEDHINSILKTKVLNQDNILVNGTYFKNRSDKNNTMILR